MTRQVHYSEVDSGFCIRLSALLRLFQDVSALHSELTGFGIRTLSEHGVTWMLGKLAIDIEHYPEYCDVLRIISRSRGASGFRMLRDFELEANGKRVGGGSSVWFYFDRNAGKVTRVPVPIDQAYGVDSHLALDEGVESWTPYERFDPESVRTYAPGTFDLDAGGHVNNARYVDYVMDAAHGLVDGSMVRSARIQFGREITSIDPFEIGIRRDGPCVLFKLKGATGMFARGEIYLVSAHASEKQGSLRQAKLGGEGS